MNQIRREKQTISEVIFRGKRNIKQNRNWFYFKLYLTILKHENLSVPLKNRPVCHLLVLPQCLSVKICCISPSDSEANRDGADVESSLSLFFSFSASFENSSPREKSESCLRFGTSGPSLCLYPLLFRNIIFFPALTTALMTSK